MENSTQMQPIQPSEEVNRYTRRSILRSEEMYGTGFQSPGSITMVENFCKRLGLENKIKILDIGSGLGGACFYFAENYDATVLGLDIAQAMVEISTERKIEKNLDKVSFLYGDIKDVELEPNSFDLVWTRDCILYVEEKLKVWQQAYKFLKPGGKLFITDFCRKKETLSTEFSNYLEQCSYYLQSVDDYSQTLENVGLTVLSKEDITDTFISCLQKELDNLNSRKSDFLTKYTQDDYDYLDTRWKNKIKFCKDGDFRWGLFIAQKPTL
ncbi:MAG: methyltransferase domain-containing protein [Acidobacteria bacterium]|nr:methyltransferase domain-containing protein [Acidobacteriota bacterium]